MQLLITFCLQCQKIKKYTTKMKRGGRGEKFILLPLYITHWCFYRSFLSPSPLSFKSLACCQHQGAICSSPIYFSLLQAEQCCCGYRAANKHGYHTTEGVSLLTIFKLSFIIECVMGKTLEMIHCFHKRKHFILDRKSENGQFPLKKLSTPLNILWGSW